MEPRVPSPLEPAAGHPPWLLLKRDDLIDPELPGNKWRKLRHNLTAAAEQGHHTLLTFGGAYSGHIRATAAAGRRYGFDTIGVIRGEEHLPLNPTLEFATRCGMRLHYLDRTRYRAKTGPAVISALGELYGDCYLLPEGGSNALAVRGCAELGPELAAQLPPEGGPVVVCCAVGTGGTLAGLAAGLPDGWRALGFPVLRGGEFLRAEVAGLQRAAYGRESANWDLECGFHFGGYARRTPELDAFADRFAARQGMAVERSYVAKMLYGVVALAERAAFAPNTRVVAVITG